MNDDEIRSSGFSLHSRKWM